MKKGTVIALIVSAALIVLGVAVSFVAVGMGAQPKQLFTDGTYTFDVDDLDDIFHDDRHGFSGARNEGNISTWPSAGSVGAEVTEGENNYAVSGNIEGIRIDWVSGSVRVVYGEGESISFSESASGGIEADEALVYSIDGGRLNISYCEQLIGFEFGLGYPDKDLTVSIPASLKDIYVDTASANVDISGFAVERDLYVSTTSGEVKVSDMTVGCVTLDSTSGGLDYSGKCDEFYGSTVSGNIVFSGACGEFEADNTSGKVEADFLSMPREVDADTVSGAVHFTFPQNASFELEFDTVSGGLDSDFAMSVHDGDYYVGTGGAEINVDTVSGGLKIKSK